MPTTVYRKALEGFLTKKIDWVADSVVGLLVDTAAYGIAVSGITFSGGQATVTTSSAHGLATGDPVVLTAVVGTASLNSEFGTVEVLSATQFRFAFTASSPTYTGGGRLIRIGADTFLADITGPSISGMSFDFGGALGDRVRVQLRAQDYLHLAEVEVYDTAPVPLPGAVWMLGSALLGGLGVARKRG